MYDNKALCDICHHTLDIERPTYTKLNMLLAQIFFSLTVSPRNAPNVDIAEFQTNLVPYPCIHYTLSSYSRGNSAEMAHRVQLSVEGITMSVFEPAAACGNCDHSYGKCVAFGMMYRGDM